MAGVQHFQHLVEGEVFRITGVEAGDATELLGHGFRELGHVESIGVATDQFDEFVSVDVCHHAKIQTQGLADVSA